MRHGSPTHFFRMVEKNSDGIVNNRLVYSDGGFSINSFGWERTIIERICQNVLIVQPAQSRGSGQRTGGASKGK